jgi:predicted secreted protein
MKKLIIISLIAILPLLSGCKEIYLTMENSGETLTLKKGNIFNVSLVTNSSTGNSWRNIDYDNTIIEMTREPIYKNIKDKKMVGAPQNVIYTFKTLKKGKTILYMEYGSHDNDKPSLKTFEIEVQVK